MRALKLLDLALASSGQNRDGLKNCQSCRQITSNIPLELFASETL